MKTVSKDSKLRIDNHGETETMLFKEIYRGACDKVILKKCIPVLPNLDVII